MSLLAALTLKVSAILLPALIGALCLRTRSASARHWVLAVGVVSAVAAPALHVLPIPYTDDLPTFLGAPLVLVAVALVACWLPGRRATRVQPMEGKTHECHSKAIADRQSEIGCTTDS